MNDDKKPVVPVGKILNGDGTVERPYIVGSTSYFFSTALQMTTIERVYGPGEYSADSKQRRYYESPHGPPGNKDLCEHILLKSGASVWFDLSEVSKYQATHPDAMEKTMKMLGADNEQIERMKQRLGAAERGVPRVTQMTQEKRSGCLGVVVLVTFICVILGCLAMKAVTLGRN
jgi:hypothetical protein